MSLLPAIMNRIRSRTAEKKLQHRFSHYKYMRFFSDARRQLTPVVESSRISNSSELSCMSLLPSSMERNGLKTTEKKWRHRFAHHNPICYHGNQWSDLAELSYIVLTLQKHALHQSCSSEYYDNNLIFNIFVSSCSLFMLTVRQRRSS